MIDLFEILAIIFLAGCLVTFQRMIYKTIDVNDGVIKKLATLEMRIKNVEEMLVRNGLPQENTLAQMAQKRVEAQKAMENINESIAKMISAFKAGRRPKKPSRQKPKGKN